MISSLLIFLECRPISVCLPTMVKFYARNSVFIDEKVPLKIVTFLLPVPEFYYQHNHFTSADPNNHACYRQLPTELQTLIFNSAFSFLFSECGNGDECKAGEKLKHVIVIGSSVAGTLLLIVAGLVMLDC